MIAVIAPCKECPDRFVGCHTECERYKAFTESCERIRKRRWDLTILDAPGQKKIRNTRRKLNKYHK